MARDSARGPQEGEVLPIARAALQSGVSVKSGKGMGDVCLGVCERVCKTQEQKPYYHPDAWKGVYLHSSNDPPILVLGTPEAKGKHHHHPPPGPGSGPVRNLALG